MNKSLASEHSLRNYIVWTGSFILLILGLIVAKILFTPKTKAMAGHSVSVSVAKSIRKDVERYVEAVGRCVAYASVDITPQVSGKVVKVYYPQGGWVKKDTPLFEIENVTYLSDLAQAKAQLAMDRAKLTLHQSQLDRSSALVSGDFVSRQDYDTYKSNVEEAKARIDLDLASVERKTIDFSRCTVKAPMDGLISLATIDEGQIVSDGGSDAHKLTNIRQVQPLYVDFSLSEKYFSDVYQHWQTNHTLLTTITSLDNPKIVTEGKLVFIDNYIDAQTLNFKLRASFKNEQFYFWPGNSVNVRINIEKKPATVLVPENAVQLSQQGYFVFVVDGEKKAQVKPVVPGQTYDGWITIEQGLSEDETVVTDGHVMLAPGASVQIAELTQ